MGFSYLLIIINIGSSSVTKKEKKGSRKYYESSVRFTTSKNELTQQKPENLLQPTLNSGAEQEKEVSLLQAPWVVYSLAFFKDQFQSF